MWMFLPDRVIGWWDRIEGWLVEVVLISVMFAIGGFVAGAFLGMAAQAGLHALGAIGHVSSYGHHVDVWGLGGGLLGAGIAFGVTYHSNWQERQRNLREQEAFMAEVKGD